MLADHGRTLVARGATAVGAMVLVVVLVGPGAAGAAPSASSSTTAGAVAGVATASAPLPEPHQDPETSRRRADDILARPEYQAPPRSLTQRLTDWAGEQFARLIRALFTGGVGSALAWGILALVLAGLAFLVTRLTRTVQHEPMRPGPTLAVERPRSPVDWRNEAEACEARGAWKDALRCRFRALVAELLARRLVRDLPGRTSGEYRADVATNLPSAAGEFAGAAELFERAWYGDVPTGPDECARIRELSDVVVARAGRSHRHPEVSVDLDELEQVSS